MTREPFERMIDEAKLARHKQDEKEFEEWVNSDDSPLFIICGNYNQSLFIWLASRRLMREKEEKGG